MVKPPHKKTANKKKAVVHCQRKVRLPLEGTAKNVIGRLKNRPNFCRIDNIGTYVITEQRSAVNNDFSNAMIVIGMAKGNSKADFSSCSTLDQVFKAAISAKSQVSDLNALSTQVAEEIFRSAINQNVSDIHFDPHKLSMHLRFRIDGHLVDQASYIKDELPITPYLRVLANFPPTAASSYTAEDGRFEITIDGKPVQCRASAFPTIHGDKLALRVLNVGQQAENIENLGISPEVLKELLRVINSPSGIFFVSGLTGSGKSTTLYNMLKILSRPDVHVMTLEDPVEYELPRVNHAQINAKAGFTFAEGLRSILRQDPNVVMVGEVRDFETAEIAMRAALTGHLILTTIHATTASGVIHRLINMKIEPYVISGAFIGALSQRLIRQVCSQCAQPVALNPAWIQSWIKTLDPSQQEFLQKIFNHPQSKFVKGAGCPSCRMTGFKGRIGIFELLASTDEIRNLIFKQASLAEIRQSALKSGMKTLLMDAVEKAAKGLTSLEEALHAVA